jgi:streptogramin lyase
MLKIRRTIKWVLLVTTIGPLLSDACAAHAEVMALPFPSVEVWSISAPGLEAIEPILAHGPEGTIWLPYLIDNQPIIDRITPLGLVTGEFKVLPKEARSPFEYSLTGLAEGPDDEMWFTLEGPGACVGWISPAGKVVEFPLLGGGDPEGIARGSDGSMWFTNAGGGKIGRANTSGIVAEYPIPTGTQTDVPVVSRPAGIAAGGEGNMWFIDDGQDQEEKSFVGHVTPTGEIAEFPIPAVFSLPYRMAVGSEGDVWFTEPLLDSIGRMTPDGEAQEFAAPGPVGPIALGSDGNIWFPSAVREVSVIARITPTGTITTYGPLGAAAIVSGGNGELWFMSMLSNSGLGLYRMIIPLAPLNSSPPVISGEAREGQVLSVSEGSWLHSPSTIAYQWQECDAEGRGCVDLPGEVAATHRLSVADLGHTLRAVLSASNAGGSSSAVSNLSAVVAAPLAPAPPSQARALLPESPPTPVLAATMTWSFGWSRAYTIVEALTVHRLPASGSLALTCHGHGCAFSRRSLVVAAGGHRCHGRKCARERAAVAPAGGSVDLAGLFKRRRLGVGARITVSVARPGWTSKLFAFTVRADGPPRVRITCGGPGSGNRDGREC